MVNRGGLCSYFVGPALFATYRINYIICGGESFIFTTVSAYQDMAGNIPFISIPKHNAQRVWQMSHIKVCWFAVHERCWQIYNGQEGTLHGLGINKGNMLDNRGMCDNKLFHSVKLKLQNKFSMKMI